MKLPNAFAANDASQLSARLELELELEPREEYASPFVQLAEDIDI